MSFSDKTMAVILEEILTNLGSQYDKSPGYLPRDLAAALAIELSAIGAEQAGILAQGWGQTATGAYLDLHAQEMGLSRNPSTKATGIVTVSGSSGTAIPIDSLFATAGGVRFQTTAEATIIAGSVNIAVEAVTVGTSGNVIAGTIIELPVNISGVTTVTNLTPTTGGTDAETDAELRVRLLERARLPATSGNEAHYIIWAKEVDGVGGARVLPLWNGAGTVKVVLIDSNKQPASGAIVSAVQSYVETQRPIGASVTYVSATGLNINVTSTLTLVSGFTVAGVKSAIEAAISAYLAGIAFVASAVSYAQIGVAILSVPGVLDYSGLTINGGTANVPVSSIQVAVLGTVTLS